MARALPRVGLLGEITDRLARDVKEYVELLQFDQYFHKLDAILVDGAVESPLSVEVCRDALRTGLTVAVAHPTEYLLAQLLRITGAGPVDSAAALVTYTPSVDSSGPVRCRTTMVPLTQPPQLRAITSAGQETTVAPGPGLPVAVGAALAAVLLQQEVQPAATTTLIPPGGATFGFAQNSMPGSYPCGGPNNSGAADDTVAMLNTQTASGQELQQFYVYYVDGVPTPYYLVLLRQTGAWSPGGLIATAPKSQGYFQSLVQVTGNHAATAQGQPAPLLIAHSPVTSAQGAEASVSLPMSLLVRSGGGKRPQQFTAVEDKQYVLPGWSVQDVSQVVSNSTAWNFYQSDVWNVVNNPIINFGTWWQSVYDGNDNVVNMPALSSASLNYEVLTVWQFSGKFAANNRSLTVTFTGGVQNMVNFLHSPGDCTGAFGGTHHHLFGYVPSFSWSYTMDLGVVAQPTA